MGRTTSSSVVDVAVDIQEAPAEPQRMSESAHRAAAKTSRELIAAMPKVMVRIPLPADMTREDVAKMPKPPNTPVCLNGRIWQIKHGEDVEVPQEVANILRRSNKI